MGKWHWCIFSQNSLILLAVPLIRLTIWKYESTVKLEWLHQAVASCVCALTYSFAVQLLHYAPQFVWALQPALYKLWMHPNKKLWQIQTCSILILFIISFICCYIKEAACSTVFIFLKLHVIPNPPQQLCMIDTPLLHDRSCWYQTTATTHL